MKAYTVFIHDNGENLNYQGLAHGAVNASKFLKSKGYRIERQNVEEMASDPPKRTHRKVIVVKHEVADHELLTEKLEKELKLEGTKQAEAILKQRKQKRK